MSIIKKIDIIVEQLPNSEKKIAKFIQLHPRDVIRMTISELAEKADSSPAAVTRFCRKIEVNSFSELKTSLSQEFSKEIETSYLDIAGDESLEDIKFKLLGNAYHSMLDTINNLTDKQVNEAIELIQKAPIIYVYGVGSSKLVAANIQQKFSRIGKVVVCEEEFHTLLPMILTAQKDSILIAISQSGENHEILKMVKHAQKRGLSVLGLSQFGMNKLSGISDVSINIVESKEAIVRSAATSSLHSFYILTDILYFMYVNTDFDGNFKRIKYSYEIGRGRDV